jgi:hypothetical protein
MRAVTIFAVSLAAVGAMPVTAAEPRTALVIGNNDYDSGLRRRDKAVNMASTRNLGWTWDGAAGKGSARQRAANVNTEQIRPRL